MLLYRYLNLKKSLRLAEDGMSTFWHSNALDSIQNKYLYFSDFESLNDASERKVKIGFEIGRSKAEINKARNKVYRFYKGLRGEAEGRALPRRKEIKSLDGEAVYRHCKMISDGFITSIANLKQRVCCFSRSNENELMWGHYADGMRGVCVEYNVELGKEAFFDVKYVDQPVQLDVFELIEMEHMAFYEINKYKSSAWNYEEEVRAIYSKKSFSLDSDDFSGMVVGYRMEPSVFEELILARSKACIVCPIKVAFPYQEGYGISITDEVGQQDIRRLLSMDENRRVKKLVSLVSTIGQPR